LGLGKEGFERINRNKRETLKFLDVWLRRESRKSPKSVYIFQSTVALGLGSCWKSECKSRKDFGSTLNLGLETKIFVVERFLIIVESIGQVYFT
jgi:hypothetical protein